MLKKLRRTRLIATDANVRKRIYTNSTTIDDEHILMGTYFTQVLFAGTCKLTSGVVRMCVRSHVPTVFMNESVCTAIQSWTRHHGAYITKIAFCLTKTVQTTTTLNSLANTPRLRTSDDEIISCSIIWIKAILYLVGRNCDLARNKALSMDIHHSDHRLSVI